jgi:hypothetical protein
MSETENLLREALQYVEHRHIVASSAAPTTLPRCSQCELSARIDAHLAKRDVVEVPREPTDYMLEQGASHCGQGMLGSKSEARNVYIAMLRAAQEGK